MNVPPAGQGRVLRVLHEIPALEAGDAGVVHENVEPLPLFDDSGGYTLPVGFLANVQVAVDTALP